MRINRFDYATSLKRRRDEKNKRGGQQRQSSWSSQQRIKISPAFRMYLWVVFIFWFPSFLPTFSSNASSKDRLTLLVGTEGASPSSQSTNQTAAEQQDDEQEHSSSGGTLLAAGESYHYSRFNNETSSLESNPFSFGSVLLYLTTDLTPAHIQFIKYCWPAVLEGSYLLRNANVLVYANPSLDTSDATKDGALKLIEDTFIDNPSLRVYVAHNQSVEEEVGTSYANSLEAMWQASSHHWWWRSGNEHAAPGTDRYDWIIRLHADVLVRNDTFLLDNMKDPYVEGIFNDCTDQTCFNDQRCRKRRIHGDALLFRPGSLREKAFFVPKKRRPKANADMEITREFQTIVGKAADRWIPGTGMHGNVCRIGHRQILKDGANRPPIVHTHDILPTPLRCASLLGAGS